jgi:polyisoprenoid-binding protein YceI
MHSSLVSVILALTLGPVVTAAQSPVRDATVDSGTLGFDGRATAGDFTGVTMAVTGELRGGPDIGAVRGAVEAPVATLKTGNDHRDRDLNKSMESDKYPTIRFELTGVTPAGVRGDTMLVTLHGVLRIHGVTRDASIPAEVRVAGDSIRVHSDFPLNLKDYGIGGLSRFFGLFKMYPDIVVHVNLLFMPPAVPAT